MTTDELRAKFVAHFSQPPYEWDFTLFHDGSGWPGSYDKYYVQCAWEAWQGAHASRDAEVEALQDALFQISVRPKAKREPDMDDMSWHTDMIARAQYFANVVTEIEALRKDAERYQALRQAFVEEDEGFIEKITGVLRGRDCTAAEFDTAIDVAREKQP